LPDWFCAAVQEVSVEEDERAGSVSFCGEQVLQVGAEVLDLPSRHEAGENDEAVVVELASRFPVEQCSGCAEVIHCLGHVHRWLSPRGGHRGPPLNELWALRTNLSPPILG
jgi:hypothetical protein